MKFSREKIFNEIASMIAKVMKIPKDQINDDTSLQDDLGIDSVDIWDIIASVQKKFKVKVAVEEIQDMKVVGDICKALESKIKK